MSLRNIVFLLAILSTIAACTTSGPGAGSGNIIPARCALPAGVTVTSITLNSPSPVNLPANTPTPFSVTAQLSGPVPNDGNIYAACFEVKDSEIVRGDPLAIGFVPFTANVGTTNTITDAFRLTCNVSNEVAGMASPLTLLADPTTSTFNRSSGERSTRIRVQHLAGIQSFLNIVNVGVSGVRSGRIRVRCP